MTKESNVAAVKAKPDVVVPDNTQLINLSAYMYQAYDTPYSSTNLATDIGFTPLTTARGKPIESIDDTTGLYAEAFVSTGTGPKQVVVAYEGTNLFGQSAAFTGAQIQDDAMIFNGTNALSFRGAASFARQVTKISARQGIRKNEVFVTGHSLGAAEAEYAASKTGLAGTTFAAPGIDQPPGRTHVSQLTNYVDAGDPIGNYAADTVLSPVVTTANIKHYGTATVLTNTSTDSMGNPTPENNVAAQQLLQEAAESWPTLSQDGKLFVLADVADQNLYKHDFHSLTQYASDLGVQLDTGDSSGSAGKDFLPAGSTTANASRVLAAAVQCFVTGTLIRTTRGSCAVEDLVVGDSAVTASGKSRRIVWIGHRDTDCRGHLDLRPVRVSADAFGPGLPERDLWLSPGHPVLVGADEDGEGGHLVPIMCLINGTSIGRVAVDTLTYWHVELDEHDILLAEDLPVESYIEWGDRSFFSEGSDHRLANPDFVTPGLAGRCRPVALDGPVVEAARHKLDAAFATRLTAAAAWPDMVGEATDV